MLQSVTRHLGYPRTEPVLAIYDEYMNLITDIYQIKSGMTILCSSSEAAATEIGSSSPKKIGNKQTNRVTTSPKLSPAQTVGDYSDDGIDLSGIAPLKENQLQPELLSEDSEDSQDIIPVKPRCRNTR